MRIRLSIRIYDLNKGITTLNKMNRWNKLINLLEFMTWIKGLRLDMTFCISITYFYNIRIYDLNKGITTNVSHVSWNTKEPFIRIYDLNKGITTPMGDSSFKILLRGLEFMTWIKGLRRIWKDFLMSILLKLN